jgi:hypothetical protein
MLFVLKMRHFLRYRQQFVDTLYNIVLTNTRNGFQNRTSPDSIPRPDWEVYIDKLAGVIAKEQSPDKLLEARAMLYELLVHLIPPSVVIVQLAKGLLTRVDDALRPEIIHWAAWYEHRLRLGNKPIFHLEGLFFRFSLLFPIGNTVDPILSLYIFWLTSRFHLSLAGTFL